MLLVARGAERELKGREGGGPPGERASEREAHCCGERAGGSPPRTATAIGSAQCQNNVDSRASERRGERLYERPLALTKRDRRSNAMQMLLLRVARFMGCTQPARNGAAIQPKDNFGLQWI